MKTLFLGGDLRQKYASDYMNSIGVPCKLYLNFSLDEELINEIKSSNALVLPLPTSKDGITVNATSNDKILLGDLLKYIPLDSLILGGNIPNNFVSLANSFGYRIIDYYENESFQIYNALLSAEGAIFYSMEKISGTIYGSKIAILGFGRIGKILAYMLKSQGAKITIFARKDLDRAWSNLIGYEAVKISDKFVAKSNDLKYDYDIIFNTIPNQIMNEEFAKELTDKTIIIDLASYPFGINPSLIEKYNLKYYRESGIPGRYAPQSAGNIIGKTIINILEQENLL